MKKLVFFLPILALFILVAATNSFGQCNVAISPQGSSICGGDSVVLTASVSAGSSPYSYSWSSGETNTSISVSPTSNTTYTVTVTDANNCTASASTSVSVIPVVDACPDQTFCDQSIPQFLSGTPAGGTWSGTGVSPTGSFNPATAGIGGHQLTYSFTDNFGCTSNDAVTIAVIVPTLANAGSDFQLCSDAAPVDLNVRNNPTPAGGTWAGSGVANAIFTAANGLNGQNIVVYSIGSGTCLTRDTIIITVNPLPVISVLYATTCEGSPAMLVASGGNSYSWSNGATGTVINVTPTSTTSYSVIGSDINGCSNSVLVTVTVYPSPNVSITPTGNCNFGSIGLNASSSGGVSYVWSTGETTPSIGVVPSTITTYSVTVVDANGCTASDSITVPLNTFSTDIYTTICQGDSIFAMGGWQYAPGTYYDTLAASNGCDSIRVTHLYVESSTVSEFIALCLGDSVYIAGRWQHTNGIYLDSSISNTGCDSITIIDLFVVDTFITNITASICPGDSIFTGGAWQHTPGTYSETLISMGGCDSVVTTSLTLNTNVWPGDANNDLIADIYDVLPLALHFGEAGIPRDSVSTFWLGQCAEDWASVQINGNNTKHADCDGNGVIEFADALAILYNYGLSHLKTGSSSLSAADAMLSFVPRSNVYLPGDTVRLDLALGTASNPVTELYGIAFNTTFDFNVAEPNSVQLDFTESWLGTVNDNLKLSKIFESSGKADGALAKTNHQNASGYGAIGTLQFIAKRSINTLQTATVSFTSYKAVDKDGNNVVFDVQDATFTIDGASGTGLLQNSITSFRIYPNPFSSSATVEYALSDRAEVSLKIFDVVGKTVMERPQAFEQQGKHFIHFENSAPGGVFIVELNVDGVRMRKRLVQY